MPTTPTSTTRHVVEDPQFHRYSVVEVLTDMTSPNTRNIGSSAACLRSKTFASSAEAPSQESVRTDSSIAMPSVYMPHQGVSLDAMMPQTLFAASCLSLYHVPTGPASPRRIGELTLQPPTPPQYGLSFLPMVPADATSMAQHLTGL